MHGSGDASHGRESLEPELSHLDNLALVEAIRRDEAGAIEAFLLRFQPLLLAAARRARIARPERDHLVADVLTDAAARWAGGAPPPSRSVAGYLETSLLRREVDARRERARCARRDTEAASDGAPHHAGAVASTCSEATLRASLEAWSDEDIPCSAVVQRLFAALSARLTVDERRLLDAVSSHTLQGEIADWLGISTSVFTQRLYRIRHRMKIVAARYAVTCRGRELDEVVEYFKRAGVFEKEELQHLVLIAGGRAENIYARARGRRRRPDLPAGEGDAA